MGFLSVLKRLVGWSGLHPDGLCSGEGGVVITAFLELWPSSRWWPVPYDRFLEESLQAERVALHYCPNQNRGVIRVQCTRSLRQSVQCSNKLAVWTGEIRSTLGGPAAWAVIQSFELFGMFLAQKSFSK